MNRIYLDYAATTPVDKEVEKAMGPYFNQHFGNPNSLHYFGQKARKAVDESREKIAKSIGLPPAGGFREVIFTGSATEANNIALRGLISGIRHQVSGKPRIIISSIEHESILETARDLEKEGVEVIYLPVNKNGIVDLKKLKESLNENTILISIIYANNETGAIQPIIEISKIINDFRKESIKQFNNSTIYPLFHTDAVQAFQFLNCNVNDLGVDLMTLSAHKIYGPKGAGLLYRKISNFQFPIFKQKPINQLTNLQIHPITTGGGQEFGLRSGTENVLGIVGFAKAIELADKNREKEFKRILELKKYFWKNLKKICPTVKLNGPEIDSKNALPNILNIYFSNQKSEELFIKLDLNGIAVSSGSACNAFSAKASYVLKAIGHNDKRIRESLRFSIGKYINKTDLDQTLKIIKILFNK